jgi:hypothetical protein
MISGAMSLLCFQASTNTNISSAAIPQTKKMAMTCKYPKYPTLKIPDTIKAVNGKLRKIILTPIMAKKDDCKWRRNQRYTTTIDAITRKKSPIKIESI